jgi:xanthine dehydrogenase YagS FAD-binding subunit
MKAFEWVSPTTVAEAAKLLEYQSGSDPYEAPQLIAGGQDLLTSMKDYLVRPARLVNLKTVRGLDRITPDGKGGLRIGALVTLAQLEESAVVKRGFPGLTEAAHSVATPQIRNLGTVGGNLCQRPRCWYFRLEEAVCLKKGGSECFAADGENKYNAILGGGPSYIVHPSDLAPMLVALGASIAIAGAAGKRTVLAEKFFHLPSQGPIARENILEPGELITEVLVPASAFAAHSTYLKFKERDSLDFAMSAVAVAVDQLPNKTVKQARIVLGGVAPIPWRAVKAERFLEGKTLNDSVLAEAATLALDGAKPLQKNAYKVPLTQTLVRRALAQAGGLRTA